MNHLQLSWNDLEGGGGKASRADSNPLEVILLQLRNEYYNLNRVDWSSDCTSVADYPDCRFHFR